MLCKINRLLSIVILAFASAFVGHSLYLCVDYHLRPQLYLMNSAPWYTSMIVNGLLTALIAGILAIAKLIVQRFLKRTIS